MKYKCLVLDHDDTVVDSTARIHYPCFVEYLEKYRPALSDSYTLESYIIKNFHPGILELLTDEVGLSESELVHEEKYWHTYVKNHVPKAYTGIKEIIAEFQNRGGIVAVDSHSYKEYIVRDYKENNLPAPDIIYGWDIPKEMRKPSPDTIYEIMDKYNLKREDIIVVDDLKPGFDMARAAGVDFAAAGWAYDVPEIGEFMRKHCDYYLPTVGSLWELLFS